MKASTLERINGRMQREINALKRNVHKTQNALNAEKETVKSLTGRVVTKEAELSDAYRLLHQARTENGYLRDDLEHIKTTWNRVGAALEKIIKDWIAGKRQFVFNWWAVKRLNKPRVEAVTEAGYVPHKLIKLAHAYWEHDKKRLVEDDEVVGESSSDYTVYRRKPGLWRRFQIWRGRA